MDRKEYIHRRQKVKITFECELPVYYAVGDPLQVFAYVAMRVGVWGTKIIHSIQLEQIENFTDGND